MISTHHTRPSLGVLPPRPPQRLGCGLQHAAVAPGRRPPTRCKEVARGPAVVVPRAAAGSGGAAGGGAGRASGGDVVRQFYSFFNARDLEVRICRGTAASSPRPRC